MNSAAAEDRKYKRQEQAKQDQAQMMFDADGQLQKTRPRVIIKHATIDVHRIVFCPFCLSSGKLQNFLVSTKKGISQGTAHCPECKIDMRMSSVLRDWTPETFAEWVFEYSKSGFWQKIDFNSWREALNKKGWSQRFWARYYELRGPKEDEEY